MGDITIGQLLLFALGQVIVSGLTALGVYGGIRADLARAIERASHAEGSARRAHERIDALLTER